MAKTAIANFVVQARYNPKKTDPEGLAVALDRLLKTALSTPGILDDYGEVTIGEFYVQELDEDE